MLLVGNLFWIFLKYRKKKKSKLSDSNVPVGTPKRKILARTKVFLGKYWILIFDLLLVLVLAYLYLTLSRNPHQSYQYPSDEVLFDQNQEHVSVTFDRPVSESALKPYISPEIKGEWKIEPVYTWLPMMRRKVTFYPQETFFADTKLFIYYSGIQNPISVKPDPWEFGIDTFSSPSQKISEVTPEDGGGDVAVDGEIQVKFDRELDKYSEWEVLFQPEVEYSVEQDGDTLKIEPKNNLAQSTEYSYEIKRTLLRFDLEKDEIIERGEPESLIKGKFTTIKEPLIESFAPQGEGIFVDEKIQIVFDAPMEQDSVSELFKIEPELEGEIVWEDEKTLVYKHNGMQKETKYTISFAQGLKSKSGGVTEKEVAHSYSTIGKLVTTGFSPANGSSNINLGNNITVSFNQEPDKSSAQSKFSISPAVEGVFSWNGNSLVFNPNADLAYGTTYTVTLAPGIKSVKGVDSVQAFSSKFTTKLQYFKLNLPVIYQKKKFSCNVDATRIALGYRGVNLSTDAVHAALPKDNTPYNENNGNPIWGNPYSGFVGDINGDSKGYGIYWGPISAFISKYRKSEAKTGWNRTALLNEVYKDNPVIIWAHNGYSSSPNGAVGQNISWKTSGGQSIYAIAGMHSFVVAGFRGSVDNPTHVILHDTNRGVWTITTSYFDSLWGVFNNSAVVVY